MLNLWLWVWDWMRTAIHDPEFHLYRIADFYFCRTWAAVRAGSSLSGGELNTTLTWERPRIKLFHPSHWRKWYRTPPVKFAYPLYDPDRNQIPF